MSAKKVFVSGCFDMLHSGHIAFLTEASSFGDLYVCIGSDKTVHQLKGRQTINTEDERSYMLNALKCVHECRVNSGSGLLDFIEELKDIKPDIFVVNEDGHSHQKEELCKELGIEYKVLKRIPHEQLPARSTTSLRGQSTIPFRIDLAGGWLDQPFVSKYHPGAVLTISIEPTVEFNNRSGMASSTRNKAIELWKTAIPAGNKVDLAKVLFSFENPPGTKEVAGSQDSLGIVMPGLNRHYYNASYWPEKIDSVHDESVLQWLEQHLYLVTLGPREKEYSVLSETNLSAEGAQRLALAADNCWDAIQKKDLAAFGKSFAESFRAQVNLFPLMTDPSIERQIELHKNDVLGYKLSGAGGGGYLIFVAEKPVKDAMQIKIRRNDWV